MWRIFLYKVRTQSNDSSPLYYTEREEIINILGYDDEFKIENIEWSPIIDELQIDVVCLDEDYSTRDLEKFIRKLPKKYPLVTVGEIYPSGSYLYIEFTGGDRYHPRLTSATLVIHIIRDR